MKGTDLRIIDLLSKDVIASDLKAEKKEEVLSELIDVLFDAKKIKDKKKAFEAVMDREKLSTTGVGYGVAIPHGKYNDIEQLTACFGRSKNGVDFDAMDHKPVHIFFLFLSSDNETNLHLKILARSCRLLKKDTFRESLMHADNEDEILSVIAREEGVL